MLANSTSSRVSKPSTSVDNAFVITPENSSCTNLEVKSSTEVAFFFMNRIFHKWIEKAQNVEQA
jgi:hypothetical protein